MLVWQGSNAEQSQIKGLDLSAVLPLQAYSSTWNTKKMTFRLAAQASQYREVCRWQSSCTSNPNELAEFGCRGQSRLTSQGPRFWSRRVDHTLKHCHLFYFHEFFIMCRQFLILYLCCYRLAVLAFIFLHIFQSCDYCYAPVHPGKFFVWENLLTNQPDSDL